MFFLEWKDQTNRTHHKDMKVDTSKVNLIWVVLKDMWDEIEWPN